MGLGKSSVGKSTFLHKRENVNSDLQHPHKKSGTASCTRNPIGEGLRQAHQWGWPVSLGENPQVPGFH